MRVPDVWMVLPADSAETAQMAVALTAERGVETQFVVGGMLVYHFRVGAPQPFQLPSGDEQ